MYQPIADLPTLNRSAAAMAPGSPSRQAISVSGTHLNSMANSVVRTAKDAQKLTASPSRAEANPTRHESAAKPMLMTSEVANRHQREGAGERDQVGAQVPLEVLVLGVLHV